MEQLHCRPINIPGLDSLPTRYPVEGKERLLLEQECQTLLYDNIIPMTASEFNKFTTNLLSLLESKDSMIDGMHERDHRTAAIPWHKPKLAVGYVNETNQHLGDLKNKDSLMNSCSTQSTMLHLYKDGRTTVSVAYQEENLNGLIRPVSYTQINTNGEHIRPQSLSYQGNAREICKEAWEIYKTYRQYEGPDLPSETE